MGLWERVLFKNFTAPAGSVANPFTQVKLTAVFTHMSGTFRVPVVCTATQPQILFPVYFAAPYAGAWTLSFELERPPGAPQVFTEDPGDLQHSFLCIASTAKGPWRPAIPEGRPFAVVEPQGDGTVVYRRPMTTTHLHLADPRWTTFPGFFAYPDWPTSPNPSYIKGHLLTVVGVLDDAVDKGFNRIRIALNYSSQRGVPASQVPANPPYWPATDPADPTQKAITQYSAFAFQNPTATTVNTKFFVPGGPNLFTSQLDYERFDLNYWNHLDWILELCRVRGIQVAITLTLNSGGGADFENEYLANAYTPQSSPLVGDPEASRLIVVGDPLRMFEYRYQLYYWYVVGRLSSYPNVQYTIMHEYELRDGATCQSTPGVNWGCAYPNSWVRWFGEKFRDIEPYLTNSGSSKIVTVCPRRGSLYATRWGENATRRVGFASNTTTVSNGSFNSRICANLSAFLAATDRSWLSCIGLQRGGEIGLATITGTTEELYTAPGLWNHDCPMLSGFPFPLTVIPGHRTILDSGGAYAPCPIFIEEDWVIGNTAFPWRLPAPVYNSLDNPYCVRPDDLLDLTGLPDGILPFPLPASYSNPYALPGLLTNQQGIEKWARDHVWGAGVIAGAMVSFWGPRYATLAAPYGLFEPEVALQPFTAASRFCAEVDWQEFSPDLSVVVSQTPAAGNRPYQGLVAPEPRNPSSGNLASSSQWYTNMGPPPLGPGAITRPAVEATVVAARSGMGASTRLIVYSPVTGTRGTGFNPPTLGPASFSLNLTGLSGTIPIQYLNPCTLTASPVQNLAIPTNPTSVLITPPDPAWNCLAPHNEYVVLINFSIGGTGP